ncbi:hypothetical protein PUN28_010631 [Cardiocondyla obscurior]|uniref:Uncharacterized protein n=1 Tax=Cardiocondyla obscurior TaxID=286306 RepID=A0AAW2FJF7_9HYME
MRIRSRPVHRGRKWGRHESTALRPPACSIDCNITHTISGISIPTYNILSQGIGEQQHIDLRLHVGEIALPHIHPRHTYTRILSAGTSARRMCVRARVRVPTL